MYMCFACSEEVMNLFYGKEKAIHYILTMNDLQKDVFFYSFVSYEIIEKILRFYSCEFLEIYENTIYYKNHSICFHKKYIETDDIYSNILFDYMKRMHRVWCCVDESNQVVWINTCKVIENCVK